MNTKSAVVPCLMLAAVAPAIAQPSDVSAAHKYCWAENVGHINWRDAGSPVGQQGARLHRYVLSGFLWSENTGYINLGDGSPAAGASYANATGADFGVNRNPVTGNLSGLAWGENIGWINFSGGAMATPPNPARYDAATRRLRGFAWGENIGWVNLDDDATYVSFFQCGCDWNHDDALNSQDFFDFLTDFFANNADYNLSGQTNSQDFFDFLGCFFEGC